MTTETTCRLTAVLDMQRSLMGRFHEIERANGLLVTPDVPVNVEDRFGQTRLRDYAWRITEEVSEALDVYMQLTGSPDPALDHRTVYVEEVADALHFLAEWTILSGVQPSDILRTVPRPSGTEDVDGFTHLFGYVSEFWVTPEHARLDPYWAWLNFIRCLGKTVNNLKFRSWKQNPKRTNVEQYRREVAITWVAFVGACVYTNVSSSMLFDGYMSKHRVNRERQAAGV